MFFGFFFELVPSVFPLLKKRIRLGHADIMDHSINLIPDFRYQILNKYIKKEMDRSNEIFLKIDQDILSQVMLCDYSACSLMHTAWHVHTDRQTDLYHTLELIAHSVMTRGPLRKARECGLRQWGTGSQPWTHQSNAFDAVPWPCSRAQRAGNGLWQGAGPGWQGK